MCKICWALVAVLLLVVSGLFYQFIIRGDVIESSDGRMAIQLQAGERDMVLSEMRAFLESTQQIISAIPGEDMQTIVSAARKVGRAAQGEVPPSLVGKLPVAFKRLGFDTHSQFDQLALDAEQMGDPEHALSQLSTLLQNCVACHSTFRIEAVPDH